MIQNLRLKNFRVFEEEIFSFQTGINLIIGKNGSGKSNILESIALLGGAQIINTELKNFIRNQESVFYIGAENTFGEKFSISYDGEKGIKKCSVHGKNTTSTNVAKIFGPVVVFHPMIMNMMYMGPSLRRDFLDQILMSSFPTYSAELKKYKKILISRNKVLKNIRDGKSEASEIHFWDEEFARSATHIYRYRGKIKQFFAQHAGDLQAYFSGKIDSLEIRYKTKISGTDVESQIKAYNEKNLSRDIILGKTNIGPHTDDLEILVQGIPITSYASRGETKSVVLGLKFLEINFVTEQTGQSPLLLIDDFMSEIDSAHQNMILERIGNCQTILTNISDTDINNCNKIFL